MTSIISAHNNSNQPLFSLTTFGGKFELVNAFTALSFAITTDTTCLITVYQSYDGVSLDNVNVYTTSAGVFFSKQINLLYKFARISVLNTSGANQTYLSFMTRWMSVIPLPLDNPTSNVVVVGGSISLAPSSNTIGTINVGNGGLYTPTNNGITSSFSITANAVNNTSFYYADETQGLNVANGWEFTSVLAGSGTRNTQINWYMYQPTQDVIITDLVNTPTNTYYTIIDNVGVEFPMIYIYTKPSNPLNKITSGTGGSSWYQSKFVYQANQAGTVGTYLLYAGADPTTIRPDLTHINLRQLDILCSGTLQPGEEVLYAALLTSSNLASPAGNFSLTMRSFGVVIAPVNTALRTDATGALAVSVDGTVSLSTLTNNNVKINPTAIQAVRIIGLGNTAQLVSTGGLCYGTSLINKSPLVNCWVKFYIKATAPTATDTPILIQLLEFVAQYNLNAHNDEWFNMPIGSKLWVRATLTATDADTTDAGIDAETTVFLGT